MKRKVHYRNPYSGCELCCDGICKKEHLKGYLKKLYKRDTRNRIKRDVLQEVKEELR